MSTHAKAQLWVIKSRRVNGWFTDDDGGNLFVSPAMAQRAIWLYDVKDVDIVPCELDDDLAQMGQLFSLRLANKVTTEVSA
jgi:hypothetical protein